MLFRKEIVLLIYTTSKSGKIQMTTYFFIISLIKIIALNFFYMQDICKINKNNI